MTRVTLLVLVSFIMLLGSSKVFAEKKRAGRKVTEKLKEIDDRLFDVEEKLSGKFPMTPIDAMLSRFGGVLFHDQKMSMSENYAGASNATDLNTETRVDLIFAGDISEKLEYLFVPAWFFMTERNNADQADRNSKESRLHMNLVYRISGTYKASNALNIKFGRIVAPFGSYIDAYAPSSEIMSHWPQMVMPQGGVLVSTVLDGIQLGGTFQLGSISRFSYRTYLAVHGTDQASYTDNPVAKHLFTGHPNEAIFGFRTILDLGSNVALGASFQGGKRRAGYKAIGVDGNFTFGRFKIRTEYVMTSETSVENLYTETELNTMATGCGGGNASTCQAFETELGEYYITRLDSDKTSYYVEPSYWLSNKMMIAARYDFIDMDNIFNHGKAKTIKGLTLNYFPEPQLMLKLNFNMHDYEAADANNAFTAGTTPYAQAMIFSKSTAAALNANPDYNEVSVSATLSF